MSLVRSIHHRLRREILAGEIAGGTRLSANALAGDLGVSRTPVRDAMNLLSAEGLVTRVPKSGFVVREFSHRELQEAFEMRLAIEPMAAELAARRITYDRVAELRNTCRRMGALARGVADAGFADEALNAQLWQQDLAFHEIVLEATRNRQMQKSIVEFQLLTCKLRYPSIHSLREVAKTLREHWHIYRALAAGDAARAALWMRRHTECGMARALAAYEEACRIDEPSPARAGRRKEPRT